MRTRFNNSEVAHVWASQSQERGKGNNFYFEGKTIYSYGSHFPIAVIHDHHYVLFTTKDYSATTGSHKSMALAAASHKTVIYCDDVNADYLTVHRQNLDSMVENIFELSLKQKRARKYDYTDGIERIIEGMKNYHGLFGLRPLKQHRVIMEDFNIETAGAARDEVRKKEQERAKRELAKKRKKAEKDVKDWKAGIGNYFPAHLFNDVFMRVSKDGRDIETSKGAKVPMIEAKAMYKTLKSGKYNLLINSRIGYYTVNAVNDKMITAGCHKITRKEIDRVLG